jgi:hypothetical protein
MEYGLIGLFIVTLLVALPLIQLVKSKRRRPTCAQQHLSVPSDKCDP